MKLETSVYDKLIRQLLWSVAIYALPVLLMFVMFSLTGQKPWLATLPVHATAAATPLGRFLQEYWLTLFILGLGIVEFSIGLYEAHWTKNERLLDITCFAMSYIAVKPLTAYFSLKA